jgi:hypothetical protein
MLFLRDEPFCSAFRCRDRENCRIEPLSWPLLSALEVTVVWGVFRKNRYDMIDLGLQGWSVPLQGDRRTWGPQIPPPAH